MNRRDFTKLFAITPAVLAASNVLAGIPESEEPISRLVTPKLDLRHTLLVTKGLVNYKIDVNNNLNLNWDFNAEPYLMQTRHMVSLKASILFLQDTWSELLLSNHLKYVRFPSDRVLQNRKFMISSFIGTKDLGNSPPLIEIEAIQVRSNDTLDEL